MKRVIIFILFTVLLPIYSFTQETKKHSISTGLVFDGSKDNLHLGNSLIGFSIYGKKGNQHLFELRQIDWTKSDVLQLDIYNRYYNLSETRFKINFSYNYSYFLFKSLTKFHPYITSCLDFVINANTFKPEVYILYPTKEKELISNFKLGIGVNLTIVNNLYLDLCIPIDVLRDNLTLKYTDNPNIKADLKHKNTNELSALPFDGFRTELSLGLKF